MKTQKIINFIYVIIFITFIHVDAFYKAIKMVGIGALPTIGTLMSVNAYHEYKQDISSLIAKHPWPHSAHTWVENIKQEIGINKPLHYVCFNNDDDNMLSMTQDCILAANATTVTNIDQIISKQDKTDDDQRYLAGKAILAKHEFGHAAHGDSWNRIVAFCAIPTTIQAGCSSISYFFTRVFNIQSPTTTKAICSRSLLAMMALVIKMNIWSAAEITYHRYLEQKADEFACEHASAFELAEFINILNEHERQMLQSPDYKNIAHDPEEVRRIFFLSQDPHPFPADRRAMVEKYLRTCKTKKKFIL